ncbi:DUF1521 domain-containing protein [Sansalvadorimonas sp. 2012CJ34-2]|uniref:DUF1521 domain-containing protein n=1 Tax=Parendozoicomonas callyspongiae TaxID=2942213 RepID=A0ABT0PI57_9GAMM|nr:DUF1521 domain-containing protein [Sansalvadorimonas sp. 2012CJ34-2]MCL6270178.1 DUF1521 domain-containing protein [Sansalvadorimonas sp. 2012CJ34-2]
MAQINGGVGGVQQTASLQGVDLNDQSLSIGDLNMLVMLERSDILDKQIRDQIGQVHKKNEQIRQLNEIQSKLNNHKINTTAVSENTWTVNHDADPKEIALDNGYKIQIHSEDESFSLVDANGNKTTVWGDPHVNEHDRGGNKDWDFQEDATFVLDDGTKITVGTIDKGRTDKNVYSDTLTITKGNQSIEVTGIADNTPQIGQPTLNGAALDADTNDGYIFKMGDQIDDWNFDGEEISGDFKNLTEGQGARTHEEAIAENKTVQQLLTPEEQALLDELGITVYDASGAGMLTPEEIGNLNEQIKSTQESLTSTSQLDMVKLQSLTGKYEQTNSLASQVLKQQYNQAKEIIRNI